MSKIKTISVYNLKAVSGLSMDFNGCTAIITGGNNTGKTTFLRSLIDRIKGVKNPDIIKHGEKEGSAEIELTNGERFVWTIEKKEYGIKEKLIFVSKFNVKKSITKDLVNKYFPSKFDIDKFLVESPKKQQETLEKLLDIDISSLNEEYKYAFEDRTYLNKRMKEELAKCGDIKEGIASELHDISGMQTEIQNAEIAHVKHESLIVQQVKMEERFDDIDAQIVRLQDERHDLGSDIHDINIKINHFDKPVCTDNALKKIQLLTEENKVIEQNNRNKEQHQIHSECQLEYEKVDYQVKEIMEKRKEILRNADLPKGFELGENGLTVDGYPLSKEALSSSSIYISALKISSMTSGSVKCFNFDASYLDKNSLQNIEEWAAEHNYQLLIEMPDRNGGEITYNIVSEIKE